jgi:hypothetical protein
MTMSQPQLLRKAPAAAPFAFVTLAGRRGSAAGYPVSFETVPLLEFATQMLLLSKAKP